ncbi:choice-of-anchor B family protein [Arenibacter sp. F26102]|uniref:choice-of-anchor B family protein n=1 Tax=Arenibacter sp. F26102 TaxID=2926416 RepID=UPI001FF6C33E|nr:choice-of-anchor B family protein [Arenibacter sp. F26102]MCK0144183.1 choice-of-anchor B family protein [Arenibacter sp. F26102]
MSKVISFIIISLLAVGCSKNSDSEEIPTDGPVVNVKGTPCLNGKAGIYPCKGYDLMGQVSLETLGSSGANDIWGWTDLTNNKEYAIIGLRNGVGFVDITDGYNPIYLGKLPTATVNSGWRDIKVYKNHAFIVSEAEGHGMQVFDLEKLRNVTNSPETFSADARYTGFGNCHNIAINEDTGFAYAVGTARDDIYNGGVHFINIQDPKNPLGSGGYGASGYTHDGQVLTYSGPDLNFTGKEVFVGANEDHVVLVDVSNKADPQEISTMTYSNFAYTHQGWFTQDQRYFILGDELDEVNFGFSTRTLVFDFTDLAAPLLHHVYLGTTSAVDHNGYVKGDEFFLSNYTAGVRVLDISGITNKSISEVGFFDTYPSDNKTDFNGVWSVYPFFPSNKIVISDINSGLFVIKKSN